MVTTRTYDEARLTTPGTVFGLFCLWSFILVCRPQDLFPPLEAVRPAMLFGVMTMIAFMLSNGQQKLQSVLRSPHIKKMNILLLLMFVSIPLSLYPRVSLTEATKFVNLLVYVYLFCAIVDSRERLKTIFLQCCCGAGLYAMITVIRSEVSETFRIQYGGMFDPNDLAYFVIAFAALNFAFGRKGLKGVLLVLNFIIGAIVVLKTGSRGGVVAFIILLMLLTRFKMRNVIVIGVLLLSVLAFKDALGLNTGRFATLFSIGEDYNMVDEEGRMAIWKAGMRMMATHPLTGVGLACFPEGMGNDRQARGLSSTRWQVAHNSLVQVGAELGVIALVVYVSLIIGVLRLFRQIHETAASAELRLLARLALASFAGLVAGSMFLTQAFSIYWSFYIAVAVVMKRMHERETAALPNTGFVAGSEVTIACPEGV